MKRYDIYEKEGAVFRGEAGSGFVTEIQRSSGWEPYEGDCRKPVVFGDFLRTEAKTGVGEVLAIRRRRKKAGESG
jgi:hypothetical protein